MALYATAAAPQSAGDVWLATVAAEFEPRGHDQEGHAAMAPSQEGAAGMPGDVMARLAALDGRIKMLATDMHMFSGELKIETMAALLTALVERQSLIGREMRSMREGMMRRMMERSSPPAASLYEEPGAMCAPSL
jgi:hypothetical protein